MRVKKLINSLYTKYSIERPQSYKISLPNLENLRKSPAENLNRCVEVENSKPSHSVPNQLPAAPLESSKTSHGSDSNDNLSRGSNSRTKISKTTSKNKADINDDFSDNLSYYSENDPVNRSAFIAEVLQHKNVNQQEQQPNENPDVDLSSYFKRSSKIKTFIDNTSKNDKSPENNAKDQPGMRHKVFSPEEHVIFLIINPAMV